VLQSAGAPVTDGGQDVGWEPLGAVETALGLRLFTGSQFLEQARENEPEISDRRLPIDAGSEEADLAG
jgi:hypothetical protein